MVMVHVLAHDLRLCLAQWPASEKRHEPGVLREQLAQLLERYPGLRLLTMDALYAERDLCQAIVSHGRDYLVQYQGEPARGTGGNGRRVCSWRNWESRRRRLRKKAGVIEKRRIWTDDALAEYIRDELGFPGARQAARWWRRRGWTSAPGR